MADDGTEAGTPAPAAAEPAPAAPPTPPTPDPALAALESRLAAAEAENRRLREDSLRPPPPAYQPPAGPSLAGLHPHVVQAARQAGLSDEEITRNGAILRPFLDAYGALIANDVFNLHNTLKDELEDVKLSGNVKDFTHYDALRGDMRQIADQAKREGRQPPDAKTRYAIALANKITNDPQFRASLAGPPAGSAGNAAAATRAADASVSSGRGTRAEPTAPTAPQSANDILSMTPAERAKFWDSVGDRPF